MLPMQEMFDFPQQIFKGALLNFLLSLKELEFCLIVYYLHLPVV